MKFCDRLKIARKHAGLTQPQLSEKLNGNITQQAISHLESPSSNGSEHTVQLAIACGVRPEWLAIGDGPMVDEYRMAEEIASKLEARERAAWYRAGRALAQPDEGTNGK